jgi:hypothetical protein
MIRGNQIVFGPLYSMKLPPRPAVTTIDGDGLAGRRWEKFFGPDWARRRGRYRENLVGGGALVD